MVHEPKSVTENEDESGNKLDQRVASPIQELGFKGFPKPQTLNPKP